MLVTRSIAAAAVITLSLAACSSDDTPSSDAPTATAPEQARTDAASVAAGLHTIDTTAAAIAAAVKIGDTAGATTAADAIEPAWQPIEGTVKANDPDAYVTFEDSFSVLENAAKDGDATKAASGAADVKAAVAAYLAKYPG